MGQLCSPPPAAAPTVLCTPSSLCSSTLCREPFLLAPPCSLLSAPVSPSFLHLSPPSPEGVVSDGGSFQLWWGALLFGWGVHWACSERTALRAAAASEGMGGTFYGGGHLSTEVTPPLLRHPSSCRSLKEKVLFKLKNSLKT
ncbi:hypothetical protein CgunFtcFv8_000123 [Champsocephalus gunnari]|uniref:Uncharacterized protein n=1 Tax=Champsocephalus gunnari TaxID=52237 RepID=A0AAN8HT39_CHAGU|nr:hypothetical protein CgunFtcFv8_000123 [Champsocephalus gunnari]